jgi:hypothetical protein
VRFHLGRCKENLGRLNEALGEYRIAAYEAEQQSLAEASDMVAAHEQLESRIPRFQVARPGAAEGSRVKLDGVELGEASLVAAITVDPGPHRIEATSLRGQRFETTFLAREKQTEQVVIEFAAVARESDTPNLKTPSADAGKHPDVPGSSNRVLPWVLGGVGVATLGASVVFLLQAGEARDEQAVLRERIGDRCVGNECAEDVRSVVLKLEDAEGNEKTFSALGYGGLAVSALTLAAATYLWLRSDSESEQALQARWFVHAGPTDASFVLNGRF